MASNLILCLILIALVAFIIYRLSSERERLSWLTEWRHKWRMADAGN